MTELLGKALDFFAGKISMRKLMFWIIVFILLWVFIPTSVVEQINAKNFSFLPDNSLFLILCVAISFLLVDFLSPTLISLLKKRKEAKKKAKALELMSALSNEEFDVVFGFIISGHHVMEHLPHEKAIMLLSAKGVIYQVASPSRMSYGGAPYAIKEIYKEIALKACVESLEGQDNPN